MEDRINKLKLKTQALASSEPSQPYKKASTLKVEPSNALNRTRNTGMAGDQYDDSVDMRNNATQNSSKRVADDESAWSGLVKDPAFSNS